MVLFLVSDGFESIKNNDEKIGTHIDESNLFLENLKNSIIKYDNFLFICNNPKNYEHNDKSNSFMAKAFSKQLKKFKNVSVLDNRNKNNAKTLITRADCIFLQGGKIPVQNKFLKKIKFNKYIKKTNAVIIGKSAGAMNLSKVVFNYPEEDSEVGDKKIYKGMSLHNFIIIPHFNTKTGNEYCLGNFNLLNDYFIPYSIKYKFYAIKNGSYVMIENGISKVFGESYLINCGKVKKITSSGENKLI